MKWRSILPLLAILVGCSGSFYGRHCEWPDGSYPDGTWQRVAHITEVEKYFLGSRWRHELTVSIIDGDEEVFTWSKPIRSDEILDFECAWENSTSLEVEFIFEQMSEQLIVKLISGNWRLVSSQ